MSDLIRAAKAVIAEWDTCMKHDGVCVEIESRFRDAVERAEKQEDEPVAWSSADGYVYRSYTVAKHSSHGKEPLPLYRHPRQPVRLSDEEILSIAENYSAPGRQDTAEIGLDGEPTGEFYSLTLWAFCSEELTAFAREVLEKAK